MIRTACIAAFAFALPLPVSAHPGGLNAEGCHNDRKRGGYHCHGDRRSAAPAANAPATLYDADVGDRYFANCSAARAAGAAPIQAGESGYSRKLDRDGDGITCE